jgi:hypothetical protein
MLVLKGSVSAMGILGEPTYPVPAARSTAALAAA